MMPEFINLLELTDLAREKFQNTESIFGFYISGAGSNITYHNNRKAFDEIELLPRFLMGRGSSPETQTDLLGIQFDSPIGFAPVGYMALTKKGDEVDAAQVAIRHNLLMCLSTNSTRSIEDVAEVGGHIFQQLYFYNRGFAEEFVDRAEKAGCKGIVVTVDSPVLSKRDGYHRFGIPLGQDGLYIPSIHDSQDFAKWKQAHPDKANARNYIDYYRQALLTWEDIGWLVSLTDLPIIVKGLLHPDDARLAVDAGAQGIVVSNHGGRQLDTAISSINALPNIVKAVGQETTIILDGGVRRGTDVIKALALGADAVWIGQPLIWGLVIDGQQGMDDVYQTLYSELIEALVMCGYGSTEEVDASIIV